MSSVTSWTILRFCSLLQRSTFFLLSIVSRASFARSKRSEMSASVNESPSSFFGSGLKTATPFMAFGKPGISTLFGAKTSFFTSVLTSPAIFAFFAASTACAFRHASKPPENLDFFGASALTADDFSTLTTGSSFFASFSGSFTDLTESRSFRDSCFAVSRERERSRRDSRSRDFSRFLSRDLSRFLSRERDRFRSRLRSRSLS